MSAVPRLLAELEAVLGEQCVFTGEAVSQRATSYWDPSPTRALALLKPGTTAQKEPHRARGHP